MRVAAILGSIVFAATAGMGAQSPQLERASTEGAKLYTTYCADCHGKDGKGAGPAAPVRGTTIPDLQLVAARNKGVFPLARVEKLLSGTARTLVIHGGIEMPLWGQVLSPKEGDRSALESRIHALARYLETLQK